MAEPPRSRDVAAAVASAGLAAAALLAGASALVDGVWLLRSGAGLRAAIAGALVAGSLATLAALIAAPFAVVMVGFGERVRERRGGWALSTWPVWAVGFAIAWQMAPPERLARQDVRAAAALLFGGGLAACLAAGRARWRGWRLGLAAGGLVLAGLELAAQRTMYPELHDLAALGAVATWLAALAPRWTPLRSRPLARLQLWFCAALIAALVVPLGADWLHPSWRGASVRAGAWGARWMRLAQRSIDLDADGFSSVAWGGDCDDLSSGRHPAAKERGHDENCNGLRPPADASEADRGLTPRFGDPELRPGADLVLLVSVDSLRADVVDDEVTPNLSALARQGLVLTRAYASGSRTGVSVPAMFRPGPNRPSVLVPLAAAGVASAAVVAVHVPPEVRPLLTEFDSWFAKEQLDAKLVTDRALALLAAQPYQPYLLWLHYSDPHVPYRMHDDVAPPVPPGKPAVYTPYLEDVAHFDREFGRLLAGVRADTRWRRVVIIVTSDHGEGLGEHGVGTHGVGCWESLVRIPTFIVAPELVPGAHGGLVSHADFPATILGAFGQAQATSGAEDWGRSLWRLRGQLERPLREYVTIRSARLASGSQTSYPLLALIEGDHKLVRSIGDGLEELYDVTHDPGETRDLAYAEPALLLRLRARLVLYQDLWR